MVNSNGHSSSDTPDSAGERSPEQHAAGSSAKPRPARRFSSRGTFASFASRNYVLLWLGMICLMGGVQMQMIARGYLVYELTERPLLLGIVNGGSAIPILLLSLWGGAIADRFDRKKIIQGGQAINAAIAIAVTYLIASGIVHWSHLLVASMLQGGMWSFMMPARQAIIPEIVGQRNLTNGLALNAAGMSAMTLVSPAIAGFLYERFGAQGVYFVITALGFLAVASTSMVRYDGSSTVRSNVPMLADIKEGLRLIAGHKLVLLLLIMGLTTTLLAMPFRFLIPVFVVKLYGRSAQELGILVSIMGLGSLTGAMFIASLGKWKRGLLLIGGSFMSGSAYCWSRPSPTTQPGRSSWCSWDWETPRAGR